MPRIVLACFCAAAVGVSAAMLAGCGSGTAGSPSPAAATSSLDTATSTDGVTSAADTPPPPETTGGTEAAGADQGAKPAIVAAGLPIGANAAGYCVTVARQRSASEVPPGMTLLISKVSVGPFPVGGDGCAGQHLPPCLGLTLTERSDNECIIPIAPAGTTTAADDVLVTLDAEVGCPAGQRAACVAFQQQLEHDGKEPNSNTVSISPPDAPPVSPPDSGPTDSPPASPSDSPVPDPGTTDSGTSGSS